MKKENFLRSHLRLVVLGQTKHPRDQRERRNLYYEVPEVPLTITNGPKEEVQLGTKGPKQGNLGIVKTLDERNEES